MPTAFYTYTIQPFLASNIQIHAFLSFFLIIVIHITLWIYNKNLVLP